MSPAKHQTMHGNSERIRIENPRLGMRFIYGVPMLRPVAQGTWYGDVTATGPSASERTAQFAVPIHKSIQNGMQQPKTSPDLSDRAGYPVEAG
jgi:hypothetical protein